MVALTITATDVTTGTGGDTQIGTLGGTVTAGEPVYKDGSASFKLKQAANTSEATAKVAGIALTGGGTDQRALYQTDKILDVGGAATEGVVYVLGAAGDIVPFADLVTGDWLTIIGTGNAAGNIRLNIDATGTQVQ